MTRLTWCTVLGCLLGLTLSALANGAEPFRVTVTVKGGESAQKNVLVRVPLELPVGVANATEAKIKSAGVDALWTGQISKPSLLAQPRETPDQKLPRELTFVVPELAAKAELVLEVAIDPAAQPKPAFHWENTEGKHSDLMHGDRPVLRYMYEAVDESGNKERRAETMKVYHHLYDPTGKVLLTKGPGGLFPHHRGIFYGFNKITYGDKQSADVWHCNGGESQQHQSFESDDVGPLFGRHCVTIGWHGKDKKVFATETRELTAYSLPGGTLVEFASRLESNAGEIKLAGDPQHAGFQFRATQEVPDKTAKQTYYVRPDGVGAPGKFRNWPGDKAHADLPWLALCFVVGDQTYTCCYLDRPENPKESRFSERDYGRFGSYFETSIDEGKPLELNYRLWVQAGALDVAGVQAESDKFVHPPTVTVK